MKLRYVINETEFAFAIKYEKRRQYYKNGKTIISLYALIFFCIPSPMVERLKKGYTSKIKKEKKVIDFLFK